MYCIGIWNPTAVLSLRNKGKKEVASEFLPIVRHFITTLDTRGEHDHLLQPALLVSQCGMDRALPCALRQFCFALRALLALAALA